jgi:hypothetical protein
MNQVGAANIIYWLRINAWDNHINPCLFRKLNMFREFDYSIFNGGLERCNLHGFSPVSAQIHGADVSCKAGGSFTVF